MIQGEIAVLRALKMEDMEKTLEWRNDLDLIKSTQGIRFPKTLALEKSWFERTLSDTSNKNVYFAIEDKESKNFIGIIQLNNIDFISGTANWGFIIGERNKQSKGFGVEAPQLLMKYAFDVLNLRKMVCYVLDDNIACLKMLDKIGYVKDEGLLKRHYYFDNEYHDTRILSIFKEDYLKD
jgi:RimJ/RimL family protein N-acetyltransferase